MSVDLSKIKPGDEVTVRVVVTAAGKNSLKVSVPGIENGLWFDAAEIVSHTPKALSVGDRVRWTRYTQVADIPMRVGGVLLAVDADTAWVKTADQDLPTHTTVDLRLLERADD